MPAKPALARHRASDLMLTTAVELEPHDDEIAQVLVGGAPSAARIGRCGLARQ